MLRYDYVSLLKNYGDIYEQRGVTDCKLGETFPNYAEIWGKYVFPNRDKSNPSKLRSGIPLPLENIFNNHYGVFYHLTFSFFQIAQFPNPLFDIGTPLYHLSTAIDLAEKTFFVTLLAKGDISITSLDKESYMMKIESFWEKQYLGSFKEFSEKSIPVTLTLHSIRKIIEQAVPEWKELTAKFRKAQAYRNALTHNLSPLKLMINGQIYIPKLEYLDKYKSARWSSEQQLVNVNEYAPAKEIIYTLAFDVVQNLNKAWDALLKLMAQIEPANEFETFSKIQARIPYEESGGIQMGYDGRYIYTASGINIVGDGRINDPF